MGKLRLIKHSDLVVEYDNGEDSNLFNFGEPKNAAPGQPNPLISGALASDQYTPVNQQRMVRMHPCCSLPGSERAGIRKGQASTSLREILLYRCMHSNVFTHGYGAWH